MKQLIRALTLLLSGILFSVPAHAATFVVSSAADAGANTLRQAILNANASGGADVIQFNFGVPITITLSTCLPSITGPTTIDGYSDPGASAGNLMIEVVSPAGCIDFDFGPGSDGSIIQGLVISGGNQGIQLRNSNNHIVRGNYIGINRSGTAMATPRLQNGIWLATASGVTIGGTGGTIDRNIISGCSQDGIRIVQSPNAVIINNYIGTSASGNAAIPNTGHGIEAYNNSHFIRVGGTTLAERNVISANGGCGLYTNNCTSPVVKGNIFGIGADGTTKLGNTGSGVELQFTGGAAQIGGITLAERNYSGCNGAFGLVVRNANNTVIEGNWLGVDVATGLLDYGNYDAAITVTTSADVRIGGTAAGAGNICSASGKLSSGSPGWGADGISIWSTSPRPIIKGNLIGVGADGVTSLRNNGHGIECLTCNDGIIGGPTVLERNIVAGSNMLGIQLVNSPNVRIYNTYVGTDANGVADHGGSQTGINIDNSSGTIIGGSVANACIISHNNGGAGIVVSNSQYVTMTYNRIYCNTGPGIDLTSAANESVPTPAITFTDANTVSGTGVNGNTIHVYYNVTGDGGVKCNCEGEIYIGTTTAAGGVWSITHGLGLSAGAAGAATATQTTPLGSTSEFTPCIPPLPVMLVDFSVSPNGAQSALLLWTTATEQNNKHFEIQHSTDGLYFETVQTIAGSGNSSELKHYRCIDLHLQEGNNYYRLLQEDFDGTRTVSAVKTILWSSHEFIILSEGDGCTVITPENEEGDIQYQLYALNGSQVGAGSFKASTQPYHIRLSLPPAVYILSVTGQHQSAQKKIVTAEH